MSGAESPKAFADVVTEQNNYWAGYLINSPESQRIQAHKYITLSYARSF